MEVVVSLDKVIIVKSFIVLRFSIEHAIKIYGNLISWYQQNINRKNCNNFQVRLLIFVHKQNSVIFLCVSAL